MIPAVRLVPPGHTLVTPGERFYGGLARYYDRAPRGAPYFPRKKMCTILDFLDSNELIFKNLFFSTCSAKSSQRCIL